MAAKYPMTKRSHLDSMRAQMENERSSFLPHWKDLADYVRPRRPRWNSSDTNKGDRRSQKIVDSIATRSLRTLTAGMMGGITSPARPWFRLSTPDPDLAEYGPVKEYLHTVTRRMNTVFLRSNLYKVMPSTYADLALFGTGCQFIQEDFDTVIHNYSIPIGSYWIGNDAKLRVRVFGREFRMTVRQVVEAFGRKDPFTGKADWSNFSSSVKNDFENGNYESPVDVVQMIYPNPNFRPGSPFPKFKKFASDYYEKSQGSGDPSAGTSNSNDGLFLSESGYDIFPVMAPRWDVTGEDVYGTSCPGMDCLADIRALQTMTRRKAQAVEKMTSPPLQGNAALNNQRVSQLPGDVTYVPSIDNGLRPIFEVDPRIQEMLLDIQDMRQTIKETFFVDIFLMMQGDDRSNVTATEVDARKQERLLILGPMLEQFNQDALTPLIDNTFHFMDSQGILPQPPEEIQGEELKVEYISIMAQAQKTLGVSSNDRFMSGVINVAQAFPQVLHKIDPNQWVDDQADALGVNPKQVRTNDEADASAAAAAQAQAAQQQVETISEGATAAKTLAETPMDTDSALNRLLGT